MAVIHSLYREAGKARIDDQACTSCGQCVAICPSEVLVMGSEGVRSSEDSPFGCIACGHCMMVCPPGCIFVTGRDISAADLLPLPPPEERGTADSLAALMQARRSVRHFTDEELAPELLERIVAMASTAPMGIPPWDVGCVVVRSRTGVRSLAAEIVKEYAGFLRVCRPWIMTLLRPFVKRTTHERFRSFILPLAKLYVENQQQGRDVLFYDAPALLIFHHSPYTEVVDTAIACTYAMLAAESLGLGSTMIGGAAPMLMRNRPLCRRLGIPDSSTPAIALILGRPATTFKRTVRRRFTQVDYV